MASTDRLLIVFSNYNGMRRTNDLDQPRIQMTIDSFRKQVPFWKNLHVLLLDNRSMDGSDRLLANYSKDSERWIYKRKESEDYYYGTLLKLIHEYSRKFQFLMVVDNDQYFFREGFFGPVLKLFKSYDDIIAIDLHENTEIDRRDRRKKAMIKGVYDKYYKVGTEYFFLSPAFKKLMKRKKHHFNNFRIKNGNVIIDNYNSKRVSWLYFPPSNIVLRLDRFRELGKFGGIQPPFKRNGHRGSQFALAVASLGRTAFLVPGVSMNIGPRKSLSKSYKIKKLICQYEDNPFQFELQDPGGQHFFIQGRNCKLLNEALATDEEFQEVRKIRQQPFIEKQHAASQ